MIAQKIITQKNSIHLKLEHIVLYKKSLALAIVSNCVIKYEKTLQHVEIVSHLNDLINCWRRFNVESMKVKLCISALYDVRKLEFSSYVYLSSMPKIIQYYHAKVILYLVENV